MDSGPVSLWMPPGVPIKGSIKGSTIQRPQQPGGPQESKRESRKRRVPYFGVLRIRILSRVPYFRKPPNRAFRLVWDSKDRLQVIRFPSLPHSPSPPSEPGRDI